GRRPGLSPCEAGLSDVTGTKVQHRGEKMKHIRILSTGVALTALLASGAVPGQAADILLKSSETHPGGYSTDEAVKYMGELVTEPTNGRIEIVVYHSAQLGEEKDTIEQTRFGVIDLNRVSLGPFNNLVPESKLPSLPYIFRSIDHMHKMMDGPLGDEILAAF